MGIVFPHEKLLVYGKALQFMCLAESYGTEWPTKHSITDQFPRAAESIINNIALAAAEQTTRVGLTHLGYSIGSALESAACLDVGLMKRLISFEQTQTAKVALLEIVKMLYGLRKSWSGRVAEDAAAYGAPVQKPIAFAHETLDVYRATLELVKWLNQLDEALNLPRVAYRKLDAAITSIALNIAEGNGRFPEIDHGKFIHIAIVSATRAATILDVLELGAIITADQTRGGKTLLRDIGGMLVGLKNYWTNEKPSGNQSENRI